MITTSDSGVGHIKQARIADRVITSHAFDTLVSGPVPDASGPAAFLAAREAAYDGELLIRDELYEWNRPAAALHYWNEVLTACEACERIELWIDPSPNDQLLFIQSLCWLAPHRAIVDKLFVVHAETPLGERCAEDMRTLQPCVRKIGSDALKMACDAWKAFCQPTPTAWFDLLNADLDVLPHLRRTVLLLLGELPSVATGLGATERLALEVLAPGDVRPMRFIHANTQGNPSRVFGLFDEIRILNRLGCGDTPAIVGLQDTTFSEAAMPDRERRSRYLQSSLSLSAFGKALVEGMDDFARRHQIYRCWGGTLLTNDHLWRWDAGHRRLLPPTWI